MRDNKVVVQLFEHMSEKLTYPQIQPVLLNEVEKRIKATELIDIVSK
ncbi:hypothetical protein KPL26_08520 [Clostridium algidicarnis]|nr:hypothetical protein [Clostridium algidicarnis]MBU3196717.1 hypothetical protein [Clostridium algidicarnis]